MNLGQMYEINKILYTIVAFILGTTIGSFLNVIADRTLRGEQFLKGGSYCENCKKTLQAKDLIPVISYLNTSGKCRYCGVKLSKFYIITEIFTGIITSLIAIKYRTNPLEMLVFLTIMYTLIVASNTDLKETMVPDEIHIVSSIILIILRIFQGKEEIIYSLRGAFVCFGVLYLVYIISNGKLGGADVKIYFPIGLALGVSKGLQSFLYSAPIGLVIIIVYSIVTITPIKGVEIPYIPYIMLGVLLVQYYDYLYINLGHII